MELADLDYARNVTRVLCNSYPNQAHDPDTFGQQLRLALMGRPKTLLQALVHPVTGYVSKAQFLTIAGVNEWLDKHGSPAPALKFRPDRFLPKPDAETVTPEERARRANMLKATAEQIRQAVRAKCIGRPAPRPHQVNDPAARLEALETFTEIGE